MGTGVSKSTIADLPETVLANIFHRLPIKSIGKCMCVNKLCLSIIKTPSFVSTNTTINSNNRIQYSVFWDQPDQWRLYFDNNDKYQFYKFLTLPSGLHLNNNAIALCNGVICITLDDGRKIMLWNPTIRKMMIITFPRTLLSQLNNFFVLGFGFDSVANDYKLVRIVFFHVKGRPCQVDIFSLTRNSWTVFSGKAPSYVTVELPLPAINGALHWVGNVSDRYVIVCFDLNAEIFREIAFPEGLKWDWGSLTLGVYQQSSIVVCCRERRSKDLEMWVMKEYGRVESWTRIWKFNVWQHPMFVRALPCSWNIVALRINGEVFWRVELLMEEGAEEMTFSTDIETGEMKEITHADGGIYYPVSNRYFEESLLLLDNVNATSWSN